jgi:hypothetical protein
MARTPSIRLFLECGAFPPLSFFGFFREKQAKQSGGKAPHSKKRQSRTDESRARYSG